MAPRDLYNAACVWLALELFGPALALCRHLRPCKPVALSRLRLVLPLRERKETAVH